MLDYHHYLPIFFEGLREPQPALPLPLLEPQVREPEPDTEPESAEEVDMAEER